ncbi:unnamed protein product [Durusdinium trenchii]|uniref:DEK-C domain-containing protein n=1 Tax=Durusdinium trenchii TaxID=1381693 RepID=A0ABP0SA63_9DINO
MAMCDVIDLDLEDSPPLVDAVPVQPDDTQLRQAIKNLMLGKDLSTISLKALRLDLEKGFGVTLEARKNDIRQLAQELVVEAQHAPPAPATPQAVEPAAKKRRIGAGMVQAQPEAQPASPVKTKAPKRKAPPSAYKLWSLEHRAIVVPGKTSPLSPRSARQSLRDGRPSTRRRRPCTKRRRRSPRWHKLRSFFLRAPHGVEKPRARCTPKDANQGKGEGKAKGRRKMVRSLS